MKQAPLSVVAIVAAFSFSAVSVFADPPGIESAGAATKPIVMDAVKVSADYIPKLSFGISLEVWKDGNTGRVISITINDVRAGSEAADKGLVARTRVERVDGRPVQEFEASFLPGTALNKIFVHRGNGSKVRLEIVPPGQTGTSVVTLTEIRSLGIDLPSTLERLEHR